MNEFLYQAESFMNDCLREDITLADIASHCGYSPFHFSRKFKNATGKTVMQVLREKRIYAAAELLKINHNVCNVGMTFGFDTHAGFTKAFQAVFHTTPRAYIAHCSGKYWKGFESMKKEKIVIRPISLKDVDDLWENVYSSMTPGEITYEKIQPAMERQQTKSGIELVAEVDGTVMMALPMVKPFWLPIGFIFTNNYVPSGDIRDELMKQLIEGMKAQCINMDISTLVCSLRTRSDIIPAFKALGFTDAWEADGWTYLMLTVV